jgi:alcohol dehydrogenase
MASHCAWILGYTIDGTQAEYLRVPHAAPPLHRLGEDVDILQPLCCPTSFPLDLSVGC